MKAGCCPCLGVKPRPAGAGDRPDSCGTASGVGDDGRRLHSARDARGITHRLPRRRALARGHPGAIPLLRVGRLRPVLPRFVRDLHEPLEQHGPRVDVDEPALVTRRRRRPRLGRRPRCAPAPRERRQAGLRGVAEKTGVSVAAKGGREGDAGAAAGNTGPLYEVRARTLGQREISHGPGSRRPTRGRPRHPEARRGVRAQRRGRVLPHPPRVLGGHRAGHRARPDPAHDGRRPPLPRPVLGRRRRPDLGRLRLLQPPPAPPDRPAQGVGEPVARPDAARP